MARVPYLTPADMPPDSQIPLMKANITRAVANSPGVARLVAGMGAYLRHDSPLDPKLRELAILQVGYTTRSIYEWAHHVEIGVRFGLTDADIDAIGRDSEGQDSHLDPLAKAVLAAAREMTIHMTLSDQTFATLRAGLKLPALVDLLVAIGEYNGLVRVMAAIEVDLEPEYLPWLARFPLPQTPSPARPAQPVR
jgi:alkylhydroperoxidase family enzyme